MSNNKKLDLFNGMIPPLETDVTYVRSEAELREVYRLDALAYGGESVSHEGLRSWWKAYPKGIYVLWEETTIVGAIGIWPIKKATYNRIIRGQVDEVDIGPGDISRNVSRRPHAYWYFGDIVLREESRNKPEKWYLFLLEEAIRRWSCEGNLAPEVHVCALGFTAAGVSLLEKFRFLRPGDDPVRSPDDKPVYQRTVSTDDIKRALAHVRDLRNEEEKYDVFISYRRKGAGDIALFLHDALQKKNLNVFRDLSDLLQGPFPEALQNHVVNTPNFIIILSPNCFNKRAAEEDYFRKEIALAVKAKKKIIPILVDKFKFPGKDALPARMRAVLEQNCVGYSDEYPEAMIERIMSFIRC